MTGLRVTEAAILIPVSRAKEIGRLDGALSKITEITRMASSHRKWRAAIRAMSDEELDALDCALFQVKVVFGDEWYRAKIVGLSHDGELKEIPR